MASKGENNFPKLFNPFEGLGKVKESIYEENAYFRHFGEYSEFFKDG